MKLKVLAIFETERLFNLPIATTFVFESTTESFVEFCDRIARDGFLVNPNKRIMPGAILSVEKMP